MARSLFACLLSLFACVRPAAAQNQPAGQELREQSVDTAPVEIDGTELFAVGGFRSYPAPMRAALIVERIVEIARDPRISSASITVSESGLGTQVGVDGKVIMTVLDSDAALEGTTRQVLATICQARIRAAVDNYRAQRSPSFLLNQAIYAILATPAFLAALYLVRFLHRRLLALVGSRSDERLRPLQVQSLEILHVERIRRGLSMALRFLRLVAVALLVYVYLEVVLGRFPWTRFIANRLFDYLVNPLRTIGAGILAQIPNIIFIAIAALLTRYLLKLIRLGFIGIQQGQVTIANFDPEWAMPTYRLVRTLVLALVLVVMYPYIPGANTDAFKGITVFGGILLSLGSSSAISSVIAGYTITYRRAYRIGDRVKIGDDVGDVTQVRLLASMVTTMKNELIIIPNSMIMNSQVVNYSTLAREKGLILHTSVTIGYDAPWRQVHAMLLRAAERTEGVLSVPKPFVLQKSLDDFYVNYELNAYTDEPATMVGTYSKLHQNIQDEFNEHGVQIMSPHYENDPADVKVVPKARWFAAPAEVSSDTTS